MSPHRTYLFLGFVRDYDMEVDSAPFFRHLTIKRLFPLCKWAEVWEKKQLTQALSNEAPREPKEKRKHA